MSRLQLIPEMQETAATSALRIDSPRKLAPAASIAVSIVVPMFNEADCVPLLVAAMQQLELDVADSMLIEFLLVDDGSSDDTVGLLEQAVSEKSNYVILRHATNRGIAAAIRTGLNAATYPIVASIDCDGSYDLQELKAMVALLDDDVDLVTASPYHPSGRVDNVPEWRLQLSRLASRLYGVAVGRELSCYTSCFRVYRRDAVVNLPVKNDGFVGVAELLCRLLEAGGTAVEHPALLRGRAAGHSKMRVVRASLGHLSLIASLASSRVLPGRRRRRLAIRR